VTSGRPAAGVARSWRRARLLRRSIKRSAIRFLISGIVIGFAAMSVVCAAVVAAGVSLAGLVAWTPRVALPLTARRLSRRRWGRALVPDAPPPWSGHPFRWSAALLQRGGPLPAVGPAAGRSGPL